MEDHENGPHAGLNGMDEPETPGAKEFDVIEGLNEDLGADEGEEKNWFGFLRLSEWIPSGTWVDVWIGRYDYTYLFFEKGDKRTSAEELDFGNQAIPGQEAPLSCIPKFPYWQEGQAKALPPFFAVNEPLPVLLAILMGFQHSIAVVGGIITPILVLASSLTNESLLQYLFSAGFICCGLSTILNMLHIRIPGTYVHIGSGLVNILGVSFTHLNVAGKTVTALLSENHTWREAYGAYIGTVLVGSVVFICFCLLPSKFLKAVFPSWIAGLTIFLLGIELIQGAFQNWGGGAECAASATALCTGNGDVHLPFGSVQYVGMGFISYGLLVVIDIFGSPFMKNGQVIFALLITYAIASVVTYEGKHFTNGTQIEQSSNGHILWDYTVPIGFYAQSLLPCIIALFTDAAASVGDISAVEEASLIFTSGDAHDRRMRGGLLGQGISTFLSATTFTLPVTIYAESVGIVSFTYCASKVAAFSAGCWLILYGLIGKVGAVFANTPNCVLGPVSTFLYGSICISGLKIMVEESHFSRRQRFIMVLAVGLGIGVILVPNWSQNNLWPHSPGMNGFVNAIRISVLDILDSGYAVGWLTALFLFHFLPREQDPFQILKMQLEEAQKRTLEIEKKMQMEGDNNMAPFEMDDNMPITL